MIKKVFKLENFRKSLEEIDQKIIEQLAKRFKLTKKIGIYKIKNNIQVLQKKREKENTEKRKEKASRFNLDEKMVEGIFKLIIKESRRQQAILTKKPKIDKI